MHAERLIPDLLSVSGICLCIFLLYSTSRIERQPESIDTKEENADLIGRTVVIPTESMLNISRQSTEPNDTPASSMRFICYVDKRHCSSCTLAKARVWDGIVAMTRKHNLNIRPTFVLQVAAADVADIESAAERTRIKYETYLDTTGVFQDSNGWITPYGPHVVVTDRNDKIVFVGDPTASDITQNEYFDFIALISCSATEN